MAVPGGIGTLEELIEVYTWSQLGIHHKPCGVLDVHGYYDNPGRVPRPAQESRRDGAARTHAPGWPCWTR